MTETSLYIFLLTRISRFPILSLTDSVVLAMAQFQRSVHIADNHPLLKSEGGSHASKLISPQVVHNILGIS